MMRVLGPGSSSTVIAEIWEYAHYDIVTTSAVTISELKALSTQFSGVIAAPRKSMNTICDPLPPRPKVPP